MSAATTKTTQETPRQLNTAYLYRCVRLSLFRRWLWLAFTAAVGLGFANLFELPLPLSIAIGLLGAALLATIIAVKSWKRHAHDYEALYGMR